MFSPWMDASPSQGTPSIAFAGTHLYTWVENGTVRVNCPASTLNKTQHCDPGQSSNPDCESHKGLLNHFISYSETIN